MRTTSLGIVGVADVTIKVNQPGCSEVQVFEDAQAGTTSFQFKGHEGTDYITIPAGKVLTLANRGGSWPVGTVLGVVKRVDVDAAFVQLELP